MPLLFKPFAMMLVLAVVLLLSGGVGHAREADAPQHIVLIVVDSLRADHLGCFGYHRKTTPFIDAIARDSVFFERAYSQSSYTAESILSMFLGVYPSSNPWGTGQYANTHPEWSDLAAHFKDNGYYTGYFSDNPILDYRDLHKSFDEHIFGAVRFKDADSNRLTGHALEFLRQHASQKTVVYLHYARAHWPYAPSDEHYLRFASERYPEPLDLAEDIRPHVPELAAEGFGPGDPRFEDLLVRYDGEIAAEDDAVKMLCEGMEALGLAGKTLIVFVGDHGEEFLEHGFVDHGWALFPESIHVPMFFHMPALLAPARVSMPVGLVDIFPTLVELARMTPPTHAFDGRSLLYSDSAGAWRAKAENRPIIAELLITSRNMKRAVIHEQYLYIAAPQWRTPAQCAELARMGPQARVEMLTGKRPEPPQWGRPQYEALFNLATDPGAQNDLLQNVPEVASAMRDILKQYQERCPPQVSSQMKISRIPKLITPPIHYFLVDHGYLDADGTPILQLEENEAMIRGLGYL